MSVRDKYLEDLKVVNRIDPDKLPQWAIENKYDRFNLDFLQHEDGKIFNGQFDVTNTSEKLYGVPTGLEEIKLVDYMVYRPIPEELMKWRDIPNYHPDSLDLENWYTQLIDYCKHGVWIDGEYWNPYMVYWLNIFVFPVPKKDEDGNLIPDFDPGHPFYCNIDRYILDVAWKARLTGQDVSLMGGRGIGKGLVISELLPSPKGLVKNGDLKIGDEIFTASGDITKVTGINDLGVQDLYSVVFGDRRETKCTTGHLWSVYDRGHLKVVEAIDIAENITYGKPGKEGYRYHVPISGEVEFEEKDLLVDPYLVGYLLGDGSYTSGGVRFATDDLCVVDSFNNILGKDFVTKKDPTNNNYYISYKGGFKKKNILGVYKKHNLLKYQLEELGMFGKNTRTKRIPDIYKQGSIEQRLSLVQGMMDSDGHCYDHRSSCEYYSVNKSLIEDLAWVIRSLGIKCTLGEDVRDNELKGYRLFIYTGKNIFRIPRKLDRLVSDEHASPRVLNFRYRTAITSMELHKGTEASRCIEVSDTTHTYLANNFIVTHNSYLWGNIMDREYRLHPNSWTVVSSTSEETTSEAWNKLEECLTSVEKLHSALKHKRITDSLSMKYSGEVIELPDGTTEDRGYLAKIEKITYGRSAGKTRGKRPTIQLIEEFAAFPPSSQMGDLKSCMRESRGSWYVGGSIKKCTVLYSGTGGTVENDQAEGIFLDPIANECIPTWDWEEAGDKGCGIFIPTHIKRSGTWEKTGCPDVKLGSEQTKADRIKKQSDPIALMGLKQEFPMTIEEVFSRRGVNIFNQDRIDAQRVRLQMRDDVPKPGAGNLKWRKSESGSIIGIEWIPSSNGPIEILEHPHWLQNIENRPPDESVPMKNLYVGGCDSIDQGTGDSAYATNNQKGSELAITIKKRIVDGGYLKYTSNLYVAKYNKRSVDVRTDWDNALKLAYYFNAEINIEYTKIGIVGWFRDKGFYHLLKKRPSIALQGGNPNKSSALIGTQASTPVIDHMDQKLAQYIEDYCEEIYFPEMLEQLRKYDRENRRKFDYVIAMGLTELADEDLMGQSAKSPAKASDGFESFGYYTDPVTGYKKFGVIPNSSQGNEIDNIKRETEEFTRRGGVRWIDASDPNEQQLHWSSEGYDDGPHY